MSSRGPDDRDDGPRRTRRQGEPPTPSGQQPEGNAAQETREGDPSPGRHDEARDPRGGGSPPGARDEPPTIAEETGERADPDAEPPVHRSAPEQQGASPPGSERPSASRASGPSPSSPDNRRDRFGWPLPEGMDSDTSAARPEPPATPPPDDPSRPAQSYNPYDTSGWRVPPAPGGPRGPDPGQIPVQPPNPAAPPRGGYSGQFPAPSPAPYQPPRGPYSGQFPASQPPPRQSGPFTPVERGPDDRRSGALPTVPDAAYQSGSFAAPPDPRSYDPARSGPIPQSPSISGAMPQVQRSGQFAYPNEVTSTGSRRVIVAPDAGIGSLLADRPALVSLLAAAALAGAMIAFIALRYTHFPAQIALHFGPAGSSQPTRIGEKRELWTIPFIVGIVLAADTALAWAVYRFDRFAARLLTLGGALVAAIAWVVLLTVLHR
ncbi:MAG: DUF1648 domain-containing protein [Thermomicrobiales bacterium]